MLQVLEVLPSTTIMVTATNEVEAWQGSWRSTLVFLDGGRGSSPRTRPLKLAKIVVSIVIGQTRRIPAGWNTTRLVISHAAVGGVSDVISHLQCWMRLRPDSVSVKPLLLSFRRDLTTVIDSTTAGGMEWRGKHIVRPEPPRVLQLRPKLFHGAGLYPMMAVRSPTFLVPSVSYKQTG